MHAVVTALSDYPEFVPIVARWHWQEWGHTDPGGTLSGWEAGLARQAGADRIPGTLVAVEAGAAVGAASAGRVAVLADPAAARCFSWHPTRLFRKT